MDYSDRHVTFKCKTDKPESREVYGHRMHVVELVFGNIESNIGQSIQLAWQEESGRTFEGLEPYGGKLSRTVLRGAKGRKTLSYPVCQ